MKKSVDKVFRVLWLSESLRAEMRRLRNVQGQTNERFISHAVVRQLPKIVDQLQALGFTTVNPPLRPIRLPFSTEAGTLQALQQASQSTGIPAIQLLTACLLGVTKNPPRKRGRPPKVKQEESLSGSPSSL